MMKKRIALFLLAAGALLLFGCAAEPSAPGAKSGMVVTCGGDPMMFELACEDGRHYGFVIGEQTELVWQDRSAFSVWENVGQYSEWDVFSCDMQVTVIPGAPTESADDDVNECAEGWYFAEKITVTGVDDGYFALSAKPVIYLYPETPADVSVTLEYDGRLVCSYPRYENGWRVAAQPDGTLTDGAGQTYNYLYWEGVSAAEYDLSQGFCVAGEDTAGFLEETLAELGLNRREANEFIVYWLPQMENNAYNLIAFQSEAYTESARLSVTPEPDTVLRVFMAWKPLEQAVQIAPQPLETVERQGFTVVEWGGARLAGEN